MPSASPPHRPHPPRTVLVTGASAGIGAAAARRLHGDGARVLVVGRSPERTAAVARDLGTEPLVADLARLADVHALAAAVRERTDRVDVVLSNAGGTWPRRTTTVDGHETTFQVNHLAPYLLVRLLEGHLAPGARVVTTSSEAHRYGRVRRDHLWDDMESRGRYVGQLAYGRSKLANLLLTRELARRWGPRVLATAAHPGIVATGFGRGGGLTGLAYRGPLRRLMRTPERGADVLVWLATAPPGDGWAEGAYHVDRRVAPTSSAATDDALAAELWSASAAAVGLPA